MNGPELFADALACRRGERLLFADLSFRLGAGGAVFVSGPNGSGKSSLLRLLATLIPAAEGRLLWGGAPVEKDLAAYRQNLHYLGHQDAIKPALSPRETLLFAAALRGVAAARSAVEEALAAFALENLADWPNRWLSAGQRRRLALSRLMVAPAPLWLLDEPFACLDPENQKRLEAALRAHREKGGRVILVSHSADPLEGAQKVELGRKKEQTP